MRLLVAIDGSFVDHESGRQPLVRPWSICVLAAFGILAAGCAREGTGQSGRVPEVRSSWPSFVALGDASRCPMRCKAITESFVRAGLGLDPTERNHAAHEPAESILKELREQSKRSDARLEVMPVLDCLKDIKAKPCTPRVLVHEKGHLYLVLGGIDVEGEFMYQLIHGESPVWLVSRSQLERAGFRRGWRMRATTDSFPVRVGEAEIRLDKLFHNFGEVKPATPLECTFRLRSVGHGAVVFDKPVVSCQCTIPNVTGPTRLDVGSVLDLKVVTRGTVGASLRNEIGLTFYEKGAGASKRLSLWLFGSQRELMKVLPPYVDFGTVVPGQSYSRMLRLFETPSDRFTLKSVETGELPITSTVVATTDENGLKSYGIKLELRPREQAPVGDHRARIVIVTTSAARPRVPVGVRYRIQPRLRPVPSTVSFGTVVVGESLEARVKLVSRVGPVRDLRVEQCPDACRVRFEKAAESPELVIGVKFDRPGVWRDRIVVVGQTKSGKEVLQIWCVAYVRGE